MREAGYELDVEVLTKVPGREDGLGVRYTEVVLLLCVWVSTWGFGGFLVYKGFILADYQHFAMAVGVWGAGTASIERAMGILGEADARR